MHGMGASLQEVCLSIKNPKIMKEPMIIKANSRGGANYGWLQTKYTFSFAQYYDSYRMGFGVLRVLNDDWIAGGGGFDTHPHDNMEIVTIMLDGAMQHKDSMGNTIVLQPDEVQAMTAGSGITHSEHNHSEEQPATLFQIWIYPEQQNIKPQYNQRRFDPEKRKDRWQSLVAPAKPAFAETNPGPKMPDTAPDRTPQVIHSQGIDDQPLNIHQQAWFSRATISEGKSLDYGTHGTNQGIFLMVINGKIRAESIDLETRDAGGFDGIREIKIVARETSDVLLIEIPMKS